MKATIPEKEHSITFRIRGEKEKHSVANKRKKDLERTAKKLGCSQSEVIRTGIDLMNLNTLR